MILMSVSFLLSDLSGLGSTDGANGEDPACQGRQVRDSGSIPAQEDPLKKGMATHSSILACETPWTRGACRPTVHGVSRVEHDLSTNNNKWAVTIKQVM